MLARAEKYANIEEAWVRHGEPLNDVPLKDDGKNKSEGQKHEHHRNDKQGKQSRTPLEVGRDCHLEGVDLGLHLEDLRTTLPSTHFELRY